MLATATTTVGYATGATVYVVWFVLLNDVPNVAAANDSTISHSRIYNYYLI